MSLELGFETIGNATLIVHDGKPVLATDPWLSGTAYFGSWVLSHAVPPEQMANVEAADAIWISHGHPDHLSFETLKKLKDKEILLPDHVGGRIRDYLVSDGYKVRVLKDREWHQISARVRICSIADCNQDAVLLVDIDGTLVANLNDASERGWENFVKHAVKKSDVSFMLALSGFGDADMINFFEPNGDRILPYAAKQLPPGKAIARRIESFGMKYFVPFASLHQYNRADSFWANDYITGPEAHKLGFASETAEIVGPFIKYDCLSRNVELLEPLPNPLVANDPKDFGDDWSQQLTDVDVDEARKYFARIETLRDVVDVIVVRVGGVEHEFPVGSGNNRGVTFEVPRHSFMEAVKWEVFDDLMIGNFTKTTVTGDWTTDEFGTKFTPLVGKYADNGYARTHAEIRKYMAEYRRRAPLDTARSLLAHKNTSFLNSVARTMYSKIAPGSLLHRIGRSSYRKLRGR